MKRMFVAALGAALLLPALPSRAPAQGVPNYDIDTGPYVFSKTTRSKRPRHGYEGFYPGIPGVYCSYERHPVRTCNRRGRCRTTSWVMKEYCY